MTDIEEAAKSLSASDPVLAALIEKIGVLPPLHLRQPFVALTRSIVGQQLSVQAANTIWTRLHVALGGELTPEKILAASEDEFRAAGLSRPKARYLKDLAERTLDGSLDLKNVRKLSDGEVMAQVTQVKGIGRWSGEMFLIFSAGHEDVLALDDAGLLRAAGWLYGLGRPMTRQELSEAGEKWRPYRSIASRYLWTAIGEGLLRGPLGEPLS